MQLAPLFARLEDGSWAPDAVTRGPFAGMQGGAAAALLCSAVEGEANADFFVASTATHFLRPVPLEPLRVSLEWVRKGRRVAVVDSELRHGDRLVAIQRATLIRPVEQGDLPIPPARSGQPGAAPIAEMPAPHGGSWMMDAMEVRGDAQGVLWFRLKRPVAPGAGSVASLLPAADWAHGLGPPLGASARTPCAIPNPDLATHMLRPPVSDWIGLEPASAWSNASIGVGWASLYDVEGPIGRVAMSIAIGPLMSSSP